MKNTPISAEEALAIDLESKCFTIGFDSEKDPINSLIKVKVVCIWKNDAHFLGTLKRDLAENSWKIHPIHRHLEYLNKFLKFIPKI